MMILSLGQQSTRLELSHVFSGLLGLKTHDRHEFYLSRHEFYLVPGYTGLHPRPQSVGLDLGEGSASWSIDGRSVTRCIDACDSH